MVSVTQLLLLRFILAAHWLLNSTSGSIFFLEFQGASGSVSSQERISCLFEGRYNRLINLELH